MRGKVLVGVVAAAVVGLYWARPDLMVALLIVIGVGVYGWRHPDLRAAMHVKGIDSVRPGGV